MATKNNGGSRGDQPGRPGADGKKPAKKPSRKPKRGPRGAFLPGNREGAAGRPKGSRNRVSLMIEALLDDEAEVLTRALIARAKRGYGQALQIVFDRIAPARKDNHIEIELPPINCLNDVLAAHGAVIGQVAAGKITPSEGMSIAGLLDWKRRTLEAIDIETRLAAVEERLLQDGETR